MDLYAIIIEEMNDQKIKQIQIINQSINDKDMFLSSQEEFVLAVEDKYKNILEEIFGEDQVKKIHENDYKWSYKPQRHTLKEPHYL